MTTTGPIAFPILSGHLEKCSYARLQMMKKKRAGGVEAALFALLLEPRMAAKSSGPLVIQTLDSPGLGTSGDQNASQSGAPRGTNM